MRPLIAGNWKMHGLALQLGEIEASVAAVKATPTSRSGTLIARATHMTLRWRFAQ
jgi:triosephosphate isomerase (TIM)